MSRVLLFAVVLLLAGLAHSCQYPVDSSELPDPRRFIIIDANLTERYGSVLVSYTLANVSSNGAYQFPKPPNATAYIVDSKGNRKDFKTDGSRDSTFRGVVGETYKLYVSADGQTYESAAETMRPCPEIDSLSALYTREANRGENHLLYDGFDVYAYLGDFAGQENYYQWDWIHYEDQSNCNIIKEGENLVQVPCYPRCWSISYNTQVIVQSDKLRDGQSLAHRLVRIPFANPPYKFYYLRVEQRSITPSVFDYLKSLEVQTQNVGTLFDIPAQTRFSPNIYNPDNPKEQILGVFNVFSARTKILYIDMRQEIPGAKIKFVGSLLPLTSDPFLVAPCVEGKFRTTIRPEGWIE